MMATQEAVVKSADACIKLLNGLVHHLSVDERKKNQKAMIGDIRVKELRMGKVRGVGVEGGSLVCPAGFLQVSVCACMCAYMCVRV